MVELKNRSLERGIIIMEVLALNGACTLADLHHQSGLPKSTIRRLLGTLTSRSIVRRSLADKKYRINITLPNNTGKTIPPEVALIADVAMPILSDLTRKVSWPSDLHLIDGHTMRIVDSTRSLSPFQLYRGVINRRLNIFGSATGLACLASMTDVEINKINQATNDSQLWGMARTVKDRAEFFNAIKETRERGYGIRLISHLGESFVLDGLLAIAVPILRDAKPVGAINLLFPAHYLKPAEFAVQQLEELQQAATKITTNLARY